MFHQKEINMTHQCKVQCFSMDSKTAEDLGIEDKGKWLPFVFNMDIINAAKLASDEEDAATYNCTVIYTTNGDNFIIDTLYEEFFAKFINWNTMHVIIKGDEDNDIEGDDDLEL